MLAELDLAIAQRLQPLRDALSPDGVLVRTLPDSVGEYGSQSLAGDVVTLFKSGKAKASTLPGLVIQETALTLRVLVNLPNLYTTNGVYEVYELVVSLLLGYKPPRAKDKISLDRWDFFREDSHWTIEIDFMVPVVVREEPVPESGPLLKLLVFNEPAAASGLLTEVGDASLLP